MKKIHDIQSIDFTEREIIVTVDQKTYHLPLSEVSKKLEKASEMERKVYKISPSGYGIHWLMIHEDLSIDGLIKLAEKLSIQNNSKQYQIESLDDNSNIFSSPENEPQTNIRSHESFLKGYAPEDEGLYDDY